MPFNAALSGLQSSNANLRVLANNIANASTAGYKKSRAEFRDVFAPGALGSSANEIGTGVKLASVSQQFAQDNTVSAETSLDLAINGKGFFVLDEEGSRLYSRNGDFRVDKDGNMSNTQRQSLVGFLTDANGNITGAQGSLSIPDTAHDLSPAATAAVMVDVNLDAAAIPPAQPFPIGFTAENPPSSTSFNNSAAMQVFDALGNAHILTLYFVKAAAVRAWRVYVGIDGVDVTPRAAMAPFGGTPNAPASYAMGELARPFTLLFDTAGQAVMHNPSSPTLHYGNAPVISTNTAITHFPVGIFPPLAIGDLTINGVPIGCPTVAACLSTQEMVDAINASTNCHQVVATNLGTSYALRTTQDQPILIGGNRPGEFGLSAGVRAGTHLNCSDAVTIVYRPDPAANVCQSIKINLDACTQFSSQFSITRLTQDGYSSGRLTSVDVNREGVIVARFSNGESKQLGQVALANFRNPQGLQPRGDTTWAETFSSGVALLGAPGSDAASAMEQEPSTRSQAPKPGAARKRPLVFSADLSSQAPASNTDEVKVPKPASKRMRLS